MPKRAIKFNLDFAKKDILSKFEIKQFDNATIEITPFMDNLSYTVSESTNIKLYVCISNDVFKQETNINIQENKIIIDLDKNIIAKKGKALAELELSDMTGVTTSTTFIFDVEGKVGEGSVVAGGTEGLVAKYQRLLKEFKQEQQLQLDDINKTLESHTEQLNANKSQLAQIESKNIEQDTRLKQVENKNKIQDVYVRGLFNESKDGRLSIEGEGNSLKLEGSKSGLVEIDKVVGNTLVNVGYEKESVTGRITETGSLVLYFYNSNKSVMSDFYSRMQMGKTYTVVFFNKPSCIDRCYLLGTTSNIYDNKAVINVLSSTYTENPVHFYGTKVGATLEEFQDMDFIILEGDYTNKPIPSQYFEGLQSSFESNLVTQEMVEQGLEDAENLGKYKVPVRLVGKNLFDGKWEIGTIGLDGSSVENADAIRSGYIKVKPNNPYVYNSLVGGQSIFFYDKFFVKIGSHVITNTFTTPANCYYIRFRLITNDKNTKVQIEEGTVATDYEEYFERTTNAYLNSPLLEGDEIVMYDGELCHYHMMKNFEFDNTIHTLAYDKWIVADNTYSYYIKCDDMLRSQNYSDLLICDKLPVQESCYFGLFGVSGYSAASTINPNSNWIYFALPKDVAGNITDAGNYINGVKVIYPLAKPYYEVIQADKLLLECANNSTLHIESIVPVGSVSASYKGNVPSVYALEETNNNQDSLIDISLCATDEMYMMIEPLLEVVPQTLNNERMISKMVDMYVAMVIRGLKTIDEVPVRYRKEVQTILDKLEK